MEISIQRNELAYVIWINIALVKSNLRKSPHAKIKRPGISKFIDYSGDAEASGHLILLNLPDALRKAQICLQHSN